jgi:methylated-DNA-protein-cysteine methyltransferase related protein
VARVVAREPGGLQEAMAGTRRGAAKQAAEKVDHFTPVPSGRELAGYQERVFEIVRRCPAGRVMTYGQLAGFLGEGYTPRTVGFVMHNADDTVPWHRVINSQGACSTGRVLLPPDKQQKLLEAEGVEFNAKGRCDLARHLWAPEEFREAGDGAAQRGAAQASLFSD